MYPARIVPVVCLLTLPAAGFQSDEEPNTLFATDRPGWTTPLLRPGATQFEGGAGWSLDRWAGGRQQGLTMASPIIRFGLSDRVELRMSSDGWLRQSSIAAGERSRFSGWSDPVLSAKLRVTDEGGRIPAVTIIPSFREPITRHALSSGGWDSSVLTAITKELRGGWSADVGVAISRYRDGDNRLWQQSAAVSFGRDIAPGTGVFVEIGEVSDLAAGAERTWTFATGVARRVHRSVQVDVYLAKAITPCGPDWTVGLGWAVRLPQWRAPRR